MEDQVFNAPVFARMIAREVALLLEQSIGDDVLTTAQAAQFLQIHPNTVLELAAQGEIPGRKLGRDWRFRRSALLDHVTSTRLS
ncbi:helix-turn-helix domain-containing protein [Deinococcus yunweiensis]|uniref:helix-turn-helix domain-containing protein n=1 Tax=Deinococcus yunweiensis TaxID=367282 RepID=UPI00398EA70F